jgi:Bacterial SH3 domain
MTRTIGALAMKTFVHGLLALALAWLSILPANAQAQDGERLKVADPYLEMRTGPGRGFPVHHVAERHEFVTIELRATDWYKVRTANDKIGWVHRRQLEATLTEAGVSKSFRDTAIDDYLTRRVQFGAAVGRFKSEPMQKIWASYRLSDALTLEGTLAQVQGVFSGTDLWHGNLLAEPWSDQRLSPFLGIGVGRFRNFPNQTLVGAVDTDANLANATVGVRYYLSERFVLRADYSLYTAFVSDQRSQEFRAITAGISFFFY